MAGCSRWPAAHRGPRDPVALTALGRFNHEAAIVDPRTGIVYLTEDRRTACSNAAAQERGDLRRGGRLQALAFVDRDRGRQPQRRTSDAAAPGLGSRCAGSLSTRSKAAGRSAGRAMRRGRAVRARRADPRRRARPFLLHSGAPPASARSCATDPSGSRAGRTSRASRSDPVVRGIGGPFDPELCDT